MNPGSLVRFKDGRVAVVKKKDDDDPNRWVITVSCGPPPFVFSVPEDDLELL